MRFRMPVMPDGYGKAASGNNLAEPVAYADREASLPPFPGSSLRPRGGRLLLLALAVMGTPGPANGQSPFEGYSSEQCPSCASWNVPQDPAPIHGNTYWVGTRGLGAILITSPAGHVLIDGGLPESAPLIERSIRQLGFSLSDVRVLLNSHAHYDHAGGLAALQRATGAAVVATAASRQALLRGAATLEDPQRESALRFPPIDSVEAITDGDTVRVGPIAVVAHLTPGHSPGGTTWSWRSCDDGRCLGLVYADSQTPVSDNGYRFSEGERAATFRHGLDVLSGLACDVLLTPHPGASRLWDRIQARADGDQDALLDPQACVRYARNAREQLERRLAAEKGERE